MEEEFQFLLCPRCHKESRNPKLLPCLHTLCNDCMQENKPVGQCPICWTPIPHPSGISNQDNLLYANLQAKLNTYQKIVCGNDLVCDRCRDLAEFWCSKCEEFFCIKCFEAHQWFSKKMSHETRKVVELKAESATQFLDGSRKSSVLFCANSTHGNQSSDKSNIYCRGCKKPLCCSCALLDNQHTQLYCTIETEIKRRQEELGDLSEDLARKKHHFEEAYNSLKDKTEHMDQMRKETQEMIQKKVEYMVLMIREKEQKLLEMVERQHCLASKELEGKLQQMAGMLKRMETGEQLVEKMRLYASDQEVMDMHLFIKESLEELRELQPLAVEASIQAGDFSKCKASLQALFERVTGERDAASHTAVAAPVIEESSEKDLTPPGKRKADHAEKAIQTSTKVLKLEPPGTALERTPSKSEQHLPNNDPQPGPSTSTPSRNGGRMPAARRVVQSGELENSQLEPSDQEDCSIIISSEEDTDEDTVLSSMLEGSDDSSSDLRFEWNRSAPGSGLVVGAGLGKPGTGRSTLVFFGMKVNKDTQMITQLAAVNGENSFKAVIQTPESVLSLIDQGVSLETGLERFLCYLRSVPKPLLVVYNFWATELTVLFKALDSFAKKWDFCTTVCGYLDTLPLIKEKIPTFGVYKMKNLVKMFLQKPLNDSSTLASAKALRDLCNLLEIHTDPEPRPAFSHCNLESYTSLQPLLHEKLLTRSAAKTLATRSLVLCELKES